ncbi:hypothetical protein [Streptomyces xantholiticus]|uniref:Uncharacterized protein n=1 Tax=Streptomyces xantholiticus TaxID=68285 RepID=A0ABV1UXX0_9ACTN
MTLASDEVWCRSGSALAERCDAVVRGAPARLVQRDAEDEGAQDLWIGGVVIEEYVVVAGVAGDGQGCVVAEEVLGFPLE